jgi:ketosteroid isomerase-like protein
MTPVDIVREGYARHARRDFAGVFELLAEDLTIWQTNDLPWGGEYSGHAGAREFFAQLAEHTTATPEPVAFIPAGKHVAVYGKLKGKANATGTEFEIDIVHLWQVTDGKIDRFEAFIDTPAMLQALGR